MLSASWLDVKLGLRMLAKHPALTVIGGLGLAVGVAVSVGFFAVLTATVYPTLPLHEGERVVALETRNVERNNEDRRALHAFHTWREELRTIRDLGAFRTVRRNLIGVGGPPALIEVAEISASGFRLARVPPELGRHLLDEDEAPGAPPVLVIGHAAWQARFGGDRRVVGKTIDLGTTTYTVVGVMPDGFAFPERHQYWTALGATGAVHAPMEGPAVYVFGRLAPGVTMEQAQAELSVVGARLAAESPEAYANIRPMVMPYTHSLTDVQGMTMRDVAMMQIVMTLLLLVVAVNVAVLFYARTARRRGEMAIRSALGASRAGIVTQLFVEALVLASVAAVGGFLLAQVGVRIGFGILETETGGMPFWMDSQVQPSTVLLTIALAALTAVIVGVVPALQATGSGLQSDLRQLSGGTGLKLGRTWTTLIVAQVAIAVAVLPAVVSIAWSDASEWTTRPTFPVEQFLVGSVDADRDEPGGAPVGDRLTEIFRRIEAEADVAGVTFVASLPGREGRIMIEDAPASAPQYGHAVTPIGGGANQLEVFGARVLAGRDLAPTDAEPDGGVIVDRAFVDQLLGGTAGVGRRVRFVTDSESTGPASPEQERWLPIVGVVENLRANWLSPDSVPPMLYYAVAPDQAQDVRLVVRTRGAVPEGLATRVRELTVAVDPTMQLGALRTLADRYRQERLATQLYGLSVALVILSVFLLSAGGVYALMSFTVAQRRREIGIRAALGAEPRQLLRSVFARAGAQLALGVLIGLGGAVMLAPLTGGSVLGGRQGLLLIPGFAVTMGIVALLAAFGPARRSLNVEPTEALRAEA